MTTANHSASNKTIAAALAKGDLNVPKVVAVKPVKSAPKPAPAAKTDTTADAPKGKVVRKADAPKTAETPKTVTKPAREVVAFVAKTIKPGTPVHVIAEDARPGSGARLYAHTHAALTLLGLMAEGRPAVPQRAVLTLMGQRAVTYHTKKGNFEQTVNHGLRLSISGLNAFKNRINDNKLANAFMDLFVTGKASADTQIAQGKVYATVLA